MRRRIVGTTTVLAVLLVLSSVPASAAEFTLVRPDGDVTGPTPVEVRIEREFTGERMRRVRASLEQDDTRLGTPQDLECVRGCEVGDPEVIYVLPEPFDPTTGAPFDIEGPLANGGYHLKVELLKDSEFQEDETFKGRIHLAVPPAAPQELTAEVDGGEVSLAWREAPEPDLETFRVERHDGEDWTRVATTSGTDHVDEPGPGTHRYRVLAQRPDGRGGRLTAASPATEVEVERREDAGEDDEGGGRASGGERDGAEAAGSGDDADDADEADDADDAEEGEPEAGDAGDADRDDVSRQRGGSRRSGSSGVTAPSTGSSGSGVIPSLRGDGAGSTDDEDDGVSELDYGDVGNDAEPDDVVVANPGGWRGGIDRVLDAERIAIPVATGLVMTGLGLHLWRWLRVPIP